MKSSYKDAIAWIAYNDSNGDDWALDPEQVQHMISVALVADLFGRETLHVARDIVFRRQYPHARLSRKSR